MAQFISSLIGFFVLNCTWLAGGEGDDSDHPIGIGGNGGVVRMCVVVVGSCPNWLKGRAHHVL